MLIELKISERSRESMTKIGRLGERIAAALRSGLQKALTETQNFIMQDELSGQILKVRTGSLRRSVITFTWSDPDRIGGIVGIAKGPSDRYARAQEERTTITPKKGKYLAVPLPKALTSSGVIKGEYNVSDLRQLNLACFRSKAGNLILALRGKASSVAYTETLADGTTKRRRKRYGFTPLFVLKSQVTIPEHGYMSKAHLMLKGMIHDALQREVDGVLAGG